MWYTLKGLLLCATIASATSTNPKVSKTISGTPRYKTNVTTRGYSLTKVKMYKATPKAGLEWALNGIYMEWSPDSEVGDPVSILYG
jgi:hypothetical protein